MENYIVSARKYRPSAFDAVVGQSALTDTLKQAIAQGKLAHAYLFCGPRGVGKTTCARIFAKTINCLNPTPQGEACDECESCRAFNEQRSLNIHELDAASNNSVEEIRGLIDKVRIPPQVGKYKVFIIDEVHMLSTAAFNAFLKTLEEPPSYVIFILATTEKHKILPTILSRCQIYDFNRMGIEDIVNHLTYVAGREGYTCEPEALNVIAQKADGGMRDALSIFDQAASFSQGHITYDKVIAHLNVLDYEYYFRVVDACLAADVPQCMLLFNEVLQKGFDGQHFIGGLASHLRDLMVCRDAATVELLEVGAAVRERYKEQAARCKPKWLYRAVKLCNDCDMAYRASSNRRLLVEITLIQVAQLDDDEAGAGRCPADVLKPLFQPAPEAAQPAGVKRTAPQAGAATVAPAAGTMAAQAGTTARTSPLPDREEAVRKLPKVKFGSFGPSIHQPAAHQVQEPVAPVATAARPAADDYEDYPITEDNIRFYWHEYVNLMPQEQTALAQRMKLMCPRKVKDVTYEVVVDNAQVKRYMDEAVPQVVAHLRRQLHNRQIVLKVRIATHAEASRRVFSKPELFQDMAKRNPSLLRLHEAFMLEFA